MTWYFIREFTKDSLAWVCFDCFDFDSAGFIIYIFFPQIYRLHTYTHSGLAECNVAQDTQEAREEAARCSAKGG